MTKTKLHTTTTAIIITVAITIAIIGCGDDGVGSHKDPRAQNFLNRFVDIPPPPEVSPLLLEDGWAWVGVISGADAGFVFYEDGTCRYLEKVKGGGELEYRLDDMTGTWNENAITLGMSFSYRVDGHILTLVVEDTEDTMTLTKLKINIK